MASDRGLQSPDKDSDADLRVDLEIPCWAKVFSKTSETSPRPVCCPIKSSFRKNFSVSLERTWVLHFSPSHKRDQCTLSDL